MGYDAYSPLATAKVNVLCVPVGLISAERFEEVLQALNRAAIVSLEDLASRPLPTNGNVALQR